MTTTHCPTSVVCREVTDRHGRVYRIGETDRDLMGRPRIRMVLVSWMCLAGVSASGYAFASAAGMLREARPWGGGHGLWSPAVWVFCQAVVAWPAGRLRESGRLPAGPAVVAGALCTLLGWLPPAFLPQASGARIGFGVCNGLGTGLVYATCVCTVAKWYPERKGGWTGFVDGGFACGSVPLLFLFLCSPVSGSSVSGRSACRILLVCVGVGLCLAVAAAGRVLRDPPENWWPAHIDPRRAAAAPGIRRALEKNPPAVRQYTPKAAARTPALWMMWFCLLGTAGVDVFGIAFQVRSGQDMGFTGGVLATAAGLRAVVDGTGRGLVGLLSDRYGRRNSLVLACLALGAAQFGLLGSGRAVGTPCFLFCSTVAGFACGTVLPLLAAMTADCFGENHNATAYGMVSSAKAVSGLAGACLGAFAAGAWDYRGALVLMGSVGLASSLPALFLDAPGRTNVRRIVPNPQPLGEEMA